VDWLWIRRGKGVELLWEVGRPPWMGCARVEEGRPAAAEKCGSAVEKCSPAVDAPVEMRSPPVEFPPSIVEKALLAVQILRILGPCLAGCP